MSTKPSRRDLHEKFHQMVIAVGKKARAEGNYAEDRFVRALLPAVNEVRIAHNLEMVSFEVLTRIEWTAVGHVDYGRKFALYCAELALGEYQAL